MLINAETLLQYQRCQRRPYLDANNERGQRDTPNDLLVKLQQDKITHKVNIVRQFTSHQPRFPRGNWKAGYEATLELMRQGVDCIYEGVLLVTHSEGYTLLSRPDVLYKQQGQSCFGNWQYIPADIELGKRPKQEYQVVMSFHAEILSEIQQSEVDKAWLMLRTKEAGYEVDLLKWIPKMYEVLKGCIQTLKSKQAPEVFISRQRCTLCHWYSSCYTFAAAQRHLSLLPGVTPGRYDQLKTLNITTLERLANTPPEELEDLVGFTKEVATKLIIQAQSVLDNRPRVLPTALSKEELTYTAPIELYFDIEAEPDLHVNFLLGVLVVDREKNTETFHSLLAERPEEEGKVWQQFLDLVWQYPDAPIYHFCVFELDTVKKLAKTYHTPQHLIQPVIERFLDIYEQLLESAALPLESYALKAIAKWLGFQWRDKDASGAKCIYWYDQWLETGDRSLLEIIERYNEDDCRATRSVKDWLVNFFMSH